MSKKQNIAVFWFRRDLRIHDNHGLYKALTSGLPVLPLFIFDTDILNKLDNKCDRRVAFIHEKVTELKTKLNEAGSDLVVKHGKPVEIYRELFGEFTITSVWFNHDFEPDAVNRDKAVTELALMNGIEVYSFKDQVIFEKDEVLKDDGNPYTVFTPYSKKWLSGLGKKDMESYPSEEHTNAFLKTEPTPMPSLSGIGFRETDHMVSPVRIDEAIIQHYDKTRDYPAQDGTSKVSVHLRFGTLSIRELVRTAFRMNKTYLNELIWREFYMMILWHFPYVVDGAFKPAYNHIPWRNNEKEFDIWCNGKTGYPIVDAAMNQINRTGYMHNRARMIVASFLTKHLLIDWRWGEAYFAEKLTDYELSSNNGGWQWAAGTGCDAAPYFRIFNPESQTKKFDPDGKYIETWLGDDLHMVQPVVDHKMARERALKVYKETLNKLK
ncbi:cryptochrome/photolyase family protein [Saccharicrinis sp. FJH54]|uniref:cryptochrome/photolyase family protein n=1 Tax=Saccharicrinis sp. FJH54 TaxID=3344665 RepID=UPI0035D3FF18